MKWKSIKSLFVVEEGDGKDKPPVKETPPKEKEKTETPNGGNSIVRVTEDTVDTSLVDIPPMDDGVPPTAQKGEVKEQFVNHLMQALETNNMEGIDYLEFKNTLLSFAKMPMDERLRFQSALTAAKTMGGTEERIFESAQFYLNILGKEETSFRKAVERGRKGKVDGELKRMEQLKAAREEKTKLIEKLKKDIEQISANLETISHKVAEDQAKIETKSNHFYASYEFVVNQIKGDIEKLKQYTQQPPA